MTEPKRMTMAELHARDAAHRALLKMMAEQVEASQKLIKQMDWSRDWVAMSRQARKGGK